MIVMMDTATFQILCSFGSPFEISFSELLNKLCIINGTFLRREVNDTWEN